MIVLPQLQEAWLTASGGIPAAALMPTRDSGLTAPPSDRDSQPAYARPCGNLNRCMRCQCERLASDPGSALSARPHGYLGLSGGAREAGARPLRLSTEVVSNGGVDVGSTRRDPATEVIADPLPGLKKRLEHEYEELPEEQVEQVAKLARVRVREFVPILAWRHAREHLRKAS